MASFILFIYVKIKISTYLYLKWLKKGCLISFQWKKKRKVASSVFGKIKDKIKTCLICFSKKWPEKHLFIFFSLNSSLLVATCHLLITNCKQFGPRSGPTFYILLVLFWIQIVWHSNSDPERNFCEKVNHEKSQQTTTKAWKITQHAEFKGKKNAPDEISICFISWPLSCYRCRF